MRLMEVKSYGRHPPSTKTQPLGTAANWLSSRAKLDEVGVLSVIAICNNRSPTLTQTDAEDSFRNRGSS
jgi:hypothetical protein